MAAGKVNLPDELLSPKPAGGAAWAGKDDTTGGNDEEKGLLGFLDDTKDQVASENSIPLSPQWLYTKPSESKAGLTSAAGDVRAPDSLPHGTSLDSIQKDGWHLDGFHDKKEWRRNVNDLESSRRWREEERETGLLGRRERRKESERESEYCKNDHRSDNIPTRETSDSRALPSSDRWHEVPSRNSGHESRRDSKWSSRWGPEDKEKDARTEKKLDLDKEESHPSFISSSRPLSESDSRDKWRPRHRQEAHFMGPTVYRAVSGFGLDRGRVEVSNMGFASGRGRSNFIGGSILSRSSSGTISAAPISMSDSLHGWCRLSSDTFRYPRGKLLDIYRKHKTLSSFNAPPEGFEEVPPITHSSLIEPLAFVIPDAEEETLLEDIWNGKLTSSETYYSSKERMPRCNDSQTDSGDMPIMEMKHGILSAIIEERFSTSSSGFSSYKDVRDLSEDPGGITAPVTGEAAFKASRVPVKIIDMDRVDDDRHVECSEFSKNTGSERVDAAHTFNMNAKLPDDASSLFDSFIPEIPKTYGQYQNSNGGVKALEQVPPLEDLGLFYRDSQGEIQGPFLYVDIISWFEQGFFGVDLPVCLSDDIESRRFQPLGDVMPHLKTKTHSFPATKPDQKCELSDASRSDVDASTTAADFTSSFTKSNQHWATSALENPQDHKVEPKISELEDFIDPNFGRLLTPTFEALPSIPAPERSSFHDMSGQDTEVVLYTGRPTSSSGSTLGKFASNLHDLSGVPSGRHFPAGETAEANLSNRIIDTDNELHPLGLLWSELDGAHLKHPLSSNIDDQSHVIRQEQFSASGNHDAWSSSYRRNTSLDVPSDAIDSGPLAQFEPELNRFSLEEHLLAQQLHKQQLQQQLLSNQNMHIKGPFLEQVQGSLQHQQPMNHSLPDLEQIWKLQLQQERLQQLQKQQQQQQEQQRRHRQLQLLHQKQQQLQQLFHKQLLHQQLRDPHRGNDMHDQVLFRQHLLHELQEQSQHLPFHHNQSFEQLMQSRFARDILHDQNDELIDALPYPKHRQMLPLEQEILLGLQQEQLQARKLAMAARQQQLVIEDDRHVGGTWLIDESGQFVRVAATSHQPHTAGPSQLDFIQSLQRSSSFELPNRVEQNFILHDRMQQGLYEQNMHPFERSISTSASTPRPNAHVVNALSRLQRFGIHEQHNQMHFSDEGQFPSGIHPHHQISNPYTISHVDLLRDHLSESNGQLPNSLVQSHLHQLRLEAELQKRGMKENSSFDDPNAWSSLAGDVENSNRGLADLLHQKLASESSQLLGTSGDARVSSYRLRESSRLFPQPVSDQSFNFLADKVSATESFVEGSHLPLVGKTPHERMVNVDMEGHTSSFEGGGRFSLRSTSAAAMVESKQFLADLDDIEKHLNVGHMAGGAPADRIVFSDVHEGNRIGHSKGMMLSRSSLDTLGNVLEQAGESVMDHRELRGGSAGLYKYEMRLHNDYSEEMHNDRASGTAFGCADGSSLKHGVDLDLLASQEGRQEAKGSQALEIPVSGKKDMRYHQIVSCSDADAPETTFVDMLRSTKKSATEGDISAGAQESSDAGPSGKGGKKKGKKGRQIDPSLLGFKVHSNRIMMGEIQRSDD